MTVAHIRDVVHAIEEGLPLFIEKKLSKSSNDLQGVLISDTESRSQVSVASGYEIVLWSPASCRETHAGRAAGLRRPGPFRE
jgi:hypothetical protein